MFRTPWWGRRLCGSIIPAGEALWTGGECYRFWRISSAIQITAIATPEAQSAIIAAEVAAGIALVAERIADHTARIKSAVR